MNKPAIAIRPGNASAYRGRELWSSGDLKLALAEGPVVVICKAEVVELPEVLTAPALHAAPVGRPVQAKVTELVEKLARVSVVVPVPPGAEIVTVAGLAVMAGAAGAFTVNVAAEEFTAV